MSYLKIQAIYFLLLNRLWRIKLNEGFAKLIDKLITKLCNRFNIWE